MIKIVRNIGTFPHIWRQHAGNEGLENARGRKMHIIANIRHNTIADFLPNWRSTSLSKGKTMKQKQYGKIHTTTDPLSNLAQWV